MSLGVKVLGIEWDMEGVMDAEGVKDAVLAFLAAEELLFICAGFQFLSITILSHSALLFTNLMSSRWTHSIQVSRSVILSTSW